VWIFVSKDFRSLRFGQLISFHSLVSSTGQGPVFILILSFAVDFVGVPPVNASDLLLVFVSALNKSPARCLVCSCWCLSSSLTPCPVLLLLPDRSFICRLLFPAPRFIAWEVLAAQLPGPIHRLRAERPGHFPFSLEPSIVRIPCRRLTQNPFHPLAGFNRTRFRELLFIFLARSVSRTCAYSSVECLANPKFAAGFCSVPRRIAQLWLSCSSC
jgi:hypothetical protein